jgi:hypothetical protein
MASKEEEYKRLRKFLNKAIRGENTDAVLRSVATGPLHLVENVEAVNNSLYIVSAKEKYLDQRLSDKGVVRPAEVGLSDEIFREIGIEVTNRKQVRDLIHQLLRVLYGDQFTRATSGSTEVENYTLEDGDNLIISFDGQESIEIIFSASQFANISSATAQEVSDAITKSIRKLGADGAAFVKEESGNNKVVIISPTDGPSSSVQILGGKAQNVLKFDQIRNTSPDPLTQWTLTQVDGGRIRATWTDGTNPSLGKVKKNDYVNIFGTAFDILNRGTFTVAEVQGGTVGNAYVEFENPNGIKQIPFLQGNVDAILFFNPIIRTLGSEERYAAAFQTSPRTLEVFMPATTKVVRRDRSGAAHIYESGASLEGQTGPYTYDTTKSYVISTESALTTEPLDVGSDSILFVDDSSEFPDEEGFLIIGLGTSHEEGPVPYISKPSSTTLRINPAYKFKNTHPIGTDVALVAETKPASPNADGTDTPFFLTDSVAGRLYAEELIKQVAATGIVILIYILYPNDEGLGKWGDSVNSEKYYIWGTEDDLIG